MRALFERPGYGCTRRAEAGSISKPALLLALVLVAGCGDMWRGLFGGSDESSAATAADGGTCTKVTRDALLAALNQTCARTADCPSGAFCDVDVGSFCNFQCYIDSECPAGQTCNCMGQCAGPAPADAGPPLDPACPRVTSVIQSAVGTRLCTFDDECPHGTYCSPDNGRCAKQCLQDSDCLAGDGGATDGGTADGGTPVCNCFGKCSTSVAKPAPPTTTLASIALDPPTTILPATTPVPIKPSFNPGNLQNLRVTVRTAGTNPAAAPKEKIHLTAGRFLEVKCPAASCIPDATMGKTCPGAGAEPYVKECDLENWPWLTDSGALAAFFTLSVRPAAGDTPTAAETTNGTTNSWTVKFQSSGTTSNVAVANFTYGSEPAAASTAGWGGAATVSGGYTGRARLTLADGTTVPLSLKALAVNSTTLSIYDPSHVLTPSGVLTFPIAGETRQFKWVTTGLNGQSNTNGVGGFLWAQIITSAVKQKPGDTAIGGSAEIDAYNTGQVVTLAGGLYGYTGSGQATMNISYDLSPDAVQACTATSCPSGFTCNGGFCVAQVDDTIAGATIASTDFNFILGQITTKWWDDWHFNDAGTPLTTLDINSVMCDYPPATSTTNLGLLQPAVAKYSGELTCFLGGLGPTDARIRGVPYNIPLFAHKDFVTFAQSVPGTAQPNYPLSSDQLYQQCISEIQRQPPLSYNMVTNVNGRFFVDANLGYGKYYDPWQYCVALGYFLTELYAIGPRSPIFLNSPTIGSRFYLWLLAEWLQLHTFIARQGQQTNDLDQILASATPITPGFQDPGISYTRVDKATLLDILWRGWSLVLADTTSYSYRMLQTISSSWLSVPDYRTQYPGVTLPSMDQNPEWEQTSGFPTIMLEAMAATQDLMTAYIGEAYPPTYDRNRNAFSAERDRLARRYGDLMRLAINVQTQAVAAHDRACAVIPTPAGAPCAMNWDGRWVEAKREFGASRDRLLLAAQKMVADANPMGLPDDDLPLFFGDPTGTTSRYFASSDYLLNTWAEPAVTSAQTSLATAREAWINMKNSQVQDDLLAADRDRRQEQIGEEYGATIIQNCGLTQVAGADVEGKDVFDLVKNRTISLENCFIDRSPTCLPAAPAGVAPADQPGNAMVAGLTVEQARHRLCLWGHLAPRLRLYNAVTACVSNHPANWSDILLTGSGDINNRMVQCTQSGGLVSTFPASYLWANTGIELVDPGEVSAANQICVAEAAAVDIPNPNYPPACLHGAMGDAESRIQAAIADVDVALTQMQTAEVRINEQWAQCVGLETDNTRRLDMLGTLQTLRQNWGDAKIAAEQAKEEGGFLSGFVSFALGAATENPGAAISGFSSMVGTAVTAGADSDLTQAEVDLKLAEDKYNDLLTNQARDEAIRACFGQAHVYKSEMDTARETIKSKKAVVDEGVVQLNNMVAQNEQRYYEGQAALDREARRPFAGYAHHYWLDEKIQRFKKEFEWAKRLTYLAMRAVEYEFQQSLPLRGDILGSQHPDQLEDAVRVLQQEQAARTINRRRPEEQSLVVSLRDDILRVTDKTTAPAGERAWTAAQRFEGRLRHPQFTIRDSSGNWLGQGVRFPLDAQAGGAPNGIALANRCGERLWRVTATIQGDGLSTSQPGSPVFFLKQNTFSSQWCQGLGDGSPRQTSAIQPTRQLFRPTDVTAPVDESRGYSAAGIYPWFNVRRSDFYKLDYQDGSSEELAGRGLYGEYILLFPKELIGSGFPLERVEDVLIRLDYLSVDNLAPITQ